MIDMPLELIDNDLTENFIDGITQGNREKFADQVRVLNLRDQTDINGIDCRKNKLLILE